MKSFISLEESIEILKSLEINKNIEKIGLLKSVGRVVACDIYSRINNPPFNKSAMDGYAINAEDTVSKGSKLKVVGTIYAGEVYEGYVNKGEAVKIMTGTKIPKGCSAVIKKEEVLDDDNYITLLKEVCKDENICKIGEDISENQLLVKKDTKLNYSNIGILASSGIDDVMVYKKVKVALITSGDEVVDIDKKLQDGKIYNSNKYSLISRLLELGYECETIDHVNDNYEEIGTKIEKLSEIVDIIITTGGASVGDKDLMEATINHIGGKILFKKVNIKPGSAVLASKKNKSLIVNLSGNPNAALTTFELLVKPMLEILSGNNVEFIKREVAILNEDYNKKSNVRRFLRGNLSIEDSIQIVRITQYKSGNGILSSTLNSNCLIEIEKGNEGLKKGQRVNVIKL